MLSLVIIVLTENILRHKRAVVDSVYENKLLAEPLLQQAYCLGQ